MGPGNARWIWGDIHRGPGERTNGFGERTMEMGDIHRGRGERVNGFGERTMEMGDIHRGHCERVSRCGEGAAIRLEPATSGATAAVHGRKRVRTVTPIFEAPRA
jgi:hypothetical protein